MLNCWAGDSMKKNGIHNPIDLHQFPWEKEAVSVPNITEEEAAEMQRDMDNWEAFMQEQKSGN